jgi:hypothetical protein
MKQFALFNVNIFDHYIFGADKYKLISVIGHDDILGQIQFQISLLMKKQLLTPDTLTTFI